MTLCYEHRRERDPIHCMHKWNGKHTNTHNIKINLTNEQKLWCDFFSQNLCSSITNLKKLGTQSPVASNSNVIYFTTFFSLSLTPSLSLSLPHSSTWNSVFINEHESVYASVYHLMCLFYFFAVVEERINKHIWTGNFVNSITEVCSHLQWIPMKVNHFVYGWCLESLSIASYSMRAHAFSSSFSILKLNAW